MVKTSDCSAHTIVPNDFISLTIRNIVSEYTVVQEYRDDCPSFYNMKGG